MPDPILGSSRWWPDLRPNVRFLKPGERVDPRHYDGGKPAPDLVRLAVPASPGLIAATMACMERTAEVCGLQPRVNDTARPIDTILVVTAPPNAVPSNIKGFCWRPANMGCIVAVSDDVDMEPGGLGWVAAWHEMGHAWGLPHAEVSWFPGAFGRTVMASDSNIYARLHEGGPFMREFGDLDVAALVRANGRSKVVAAPLPAVDETQAEIAAVALMAEQLAPKLNKANRPTAEDIGRRLRALLD